MGLAARQSVAQTAKRATMSGIGRSNDVDFWRDAATHDAAIVPRQNAGDRVQMAAAGKGFLRMLNADLGYDPRNTSALLLDCGFNLIIASDGLEALQKAREFKGKIDLLLSDVEMPGMTGIELAIQLNQGRPDTKILLISGLATGILVLNDGWQFLAKLFLSDQFRDRIRDFLSEQPPIKEHLPRRLTPRRIHAV